MADIVKQISENKELKAFIKKNEININDNLIPLYSYLCKLEKCTNCQGLEECQQTIKGYCPNINVMETKVITGFEKCSYMLKAEENSRIRSNLRLISCSFSNYDFSEVNQNESRKEVLNNIKRIYKGVKDNTPTKGIFVYGTYGCGKTYLMAYLADQIAKLGKKVIFAYYPDLIRQIKSSIGTGELETIIYELKNVDALFFDDFGGEQNTDFIRDEVLGVILNDRINTKKLTCMTSNLGPKLLISHISNGNKEIDEVKAARIYERISSLMDFVDFKDTTYYR